MGVHDYVCFLQQNGQNLKALHLLDEKVVERNPFRRREDDEESEDDEEDNEAGCDEAIIVVIPQDIKVHSLHLSEFKQFPTITAQYDWDSWSFEEIEGYEDHLHNLRDAEGETGAVWRSASRPGIQLVNFEPNTYKVFVEQSIAPQRVPYSFYRLLLEARDIPHPGKHFADKDFLFTLISRPLNFGGKPLDSLESHLSSFVAAGGKDLLPLIAQYARPAVLTARNLQDLLWIRSYKLAFNEEDKESIVKGMPAYSCTAEVLRELLHFGAGKKMPESVYDLAPKDIKVLIELKEHYGLSISGTNSVLFEDIILNQASVPVLQYIREEWKYNNEKALNKLFLEKIRFECIAEARELLRFPCMKDPLKDWKHSDTVTLCRNGRSSTLSLLLELGLPKEHLMLDGACLKAANRGNHDKVLEILRKAGVY